MDIFTEEEKTKLLAVTKVLNTINNDIKVSAINLGFVKSASYDDELKFEYNFNYILNTDLNALMTDLATVKYINILREVLYNVADLMNVKDMEYLSEIGYSKQIQREYDYNEVSFVNKCNENKDNTAPSYLGNNIYTINSLWCTLLNSKKNLELLGYTKSQTTYLQGKLNRMGFHLRKNNSRSLTNLKIDANNIAKITEDPSSIKLEKEKLVARKQELKKELARVSSQLLLLERRK
jgi:hypothetical protein